MSDADIVVTSSPGTPQKPRPGSETSSSDQLFILQALLRRPALGPIQVLEVRDERVVEDEVLGLNLAAKPLASGKLHPLQPLRERAPP